MEQHIKQARNHALAGRLDEAVHALITAVQELADQLKSSADATKEPEEPTTVSEETRSALLELRKAFFGLLEVATEEDWELLTCKYPFHLSFDELTYAVTEWVENHTNRALTKKYL